eukprot:CAMPEP_0114169204 /NCGR_PEP_ID=MMETSP0043_2-20121206/33439_1 /TAXON_ID=464988 /ORGANISM="Hemiselmis andersenii, Strain CCMP644" /LENGTH=47 /DNA_ID= /DNA_START= /DNA_END= /DNA_ORIENTATION=
MGLKDALSRGFSRSFTKLTREELEKQIADEIVAREESERHVEQLQAQ